MSIFTIQTPDGRKLKIEAADEATAIKGAQEWTAANPPKPAQMDAAGFNEHLATGEQSSNIERAAAPAPSAMDFATQGMSGLNEGIAMGLGAPVDLATLLINAGTTGVNKLTGATIPQIENPIGGSQRIREGMLAPTIKPESDDPLLKGVRRVTQEVGAWAVPGGGLAAKTAKPLKTLLKELPSALGSGTGAAVAQTVAPGNPLAEFAGQMVGGLTPTAAGRMLERGPAPAAAMTVDDLRTAKNAAYDESRNLGVAYAPSAYDGLLSNVAKAAEADGISPTRHKQAYSFIEDMIANRGKPLSLTELDQLRQRVRRDLITPSYGNPAAAADAHFGEIILDNIDDFIDNAKPADLIAGNAKEAANTIIKARSLNTRLRKAEVIQDAIDKAKLNAASSGSGGNLNNAIRQQMKAILTNKKKIASFTAAERAALESLVKQGKMDDLLRWLGKFSPGGNGLIGALEVVGTLHNPALAAMPVAGMVAKGIADSGTVRKAQDLQQMVMQAPRVPSPPRRPLPMPPPSVVYAQGANQLGNGPLEITVRGGAR